MKRPTYAEVGGVMWCVVHHGIVDECSDHDGVCDNVVDEIGPCDVRSVFYIKQEGDIT